MHRANRHNPLSCDSKTMSLISPQCVDNPAMRPQDRDLIVLEAIVLENQVRILPKTIVLINDMDFSSLRKYCSGIVSAFGVKNSIAAIHLNER